MIAPTLAETCSLTPICFSKIMARMLRMRMTREAVCFQTGDAGEIFGGELVVVRADKILVVRQQLIAEHRKIQNAEDEHRQADADVLKEAGLDAKLIERICADEVAGRADDREVAAERGCEKRAA